MITQEKLIEKYLAPVLDNSDLGFYDPALQPALKRMEKVVNRLNDVNLIAWVSSVKTMIRLGM